MKPAKTHTTKTLTKGVRLNWQRIGTVPKVILTSQMIIGEKVVFKNTNSTPIKYLVP